MLRRMRYTSPDEARSDLFLSAAVFLIGPLIVSLILEIIPLGALPGVGVVLGLLLPVVYTVLVPYLLIRYRKESIRDYTRPGAGSGFGIGLLLAAPIIAATVLLFVAAGTEPAQALPVLRVQGPQGALVVLQRLLAWLGVAGLGIYATGKARDAFGHDPRTLRDGTLEIGRILGIVAVVATLLLFVSGTADALELVLPALGVAAAIWIALSRMRGPGTTSRAVLLTPTVLLALGVFTLAFNAFVQSAYRAALYAGFGLLIGILMEGRNSAYAVLALALAIALLSPIPAFGQ